MQMRVARWELDFDPASTADCFARFVEAKPCECTDCRNFRAAGNAAFTEPFLALAVQLGIDASKPSELCHYGQPGTPSLTHGWFHIVGSIMSGRDAWLQVDENTWHGDLESGFGLSGIGFTSRIHLLPDAFADRPVVQLEFETIVPWVLVE
jgi:hypothetical protein